MASLRLQVDRLDASLGGWHACPHEHGVGAGEELRFGKLLAPSVDNLLERATAGRHPIEMGPSDDDGVVVAPYGAGICRRIADRHGESATRGNFLDLPVGEEADPRAVRREERPRAALRAANRLHGHGVELTAHEPASGRSTQSRGHLETARGRRPLRRSVQRAEAPTPGLGWQTGSMEDRPARGARARPSARPAQHPRRLRRSAATSSGVDGAAAIELRSASPGWTSSSSSRTSPMCCRRRFGSFCRQRVSKRRTSSGVRLADRSTADRRAGQPPACRPRRRL